MKENLFLEKNILRNILKDNGLIKKIKCKICSKILNNNNIDVTIDMSQGECYCANCAKNIEHCCICSNILSKNDFYYIENLDGHKLCYNCAYNCNLYKCCCCNKFYVNNRIYIQNHGDLCPECYKKTETFKCDRCEYHYLPIRLGRDGDCITCSNNRVSNSMNYTYTPSLRFKRTNNDTEDNLLFLGVEVEAGDAISANKVMSFIDDSGNNFFYFKRDATIPAYGCEIVTHPATLNYHTDAANWNDLLNKAKRYGLHSDIERCGIHIHMSRSFFTGNEIKLMDCLVNINSDFWRKIARRDSHFSEYVMKTPYNWGRQTTDRHCALNLENSETVELRIFKGTLDINVLLAYLQITYCLAYFTKQEVAKDFLSKIRKDDFKIKDLEQLFLDFIKTKNFSCLNEYLKSIIF